MTAKTQKQQPVVTLRIVRGMPTPAQKTAWRRFWQKLIAEVKDQKEG